MCCFSVTVESVSATRIFARSAEQGRQFLAYGMAYSAKDDLAMILPLPKPAGSGDDAVRFISLKDYPDFFKDLARGFPKPAKADSTPQTPGLPPAAAAPLPVVEVGDFEASFVPSVPDFSRLDLRFRLPEGIWDTLPSYKAFGFAVFKLKKGARTAHPMAFEFPRANPRQLFFPAVHIHDGQLHEKAVFDHRLYCQSREDEALQTRTWTESPQPASRFMAVAAAQGLIEGSRHVLLKELRGEGKNEDLRV